MIHRFEHLRDRRQAAPAEETQPESRIADLRERIERALSDRPKQCLLAALAAGVILGWIAKRR